MSGVQFLRTVLTMFKRASSIFPPSLVVSTTAVILGDNEPFDFLTWFEFAPSDSQAFDKLVAELRASEEWTYVDREVDIRLVRE